MVAVGAGPAVRVGVAPLGGSRGSMAVPRVCLPPRGSRVCTAVLGGHLLLWFGVLGGHLLLRFDGLIP